MDCKHFQQETRNLQSSINQLMIAFKSKETFTQRVITRGNFGS